VLRGSGFPDESSAKGAAGVRSSSDEKRILGGVGVVIVSPPEVCSSKVRVKELGAGAMFRELGFVVRL
jgi:hypothetical protein